MAAYHKDTWTEKACSALAHPVSSPLISSLLYGSKHSLQVSIKVQCALIKVAGVQIGEPWSHLHTALFNLYPRKAVDRHT